jgi:hypothetical protein
MYMRRRMNRPGREAREVLREGDIDGPNASASTFLDNVRKRKENKSVQINAVAEQQMRPYKERRERARSCQEACRKKRQAVLDDSADRRANMEEWRKAGIRERIPLVDWATWVRASVLGFLASVDFFVFAQAAAVVFDVKSSISNPAYLLGGLLGLVVFLLGLFFAQSLKKMTLAFAQAKLTPPGGVARPSSANLGSVVATGLAFVIACIVGLFIRLEAETDESTSVVLFQMLLPWAVVVAEYFLHDPTHIRSPRPTLRERWHDRRFEKNDNRIASIQRDMANALQYNEQFYAQEAAILSRHLEDRGLLSPTAGRSSA